MCCWAHEIKIHANFKILLFYLAFYSIIILNILNPELNLFLDAEPLEVKTIG